MFDFLQYLVLESLKEKMYLKKRKNTDMNCYDTKAIIFKEVSSNQNSGLLNNKHRTDILLTIDRLFCFLLIIIYMRSYFIMQHFIF